MITYLELQDKDVNQLVEFLTGDTWPYHGQPNPKAESIIDSFEKGFYISEGNKTFWIIYDNVKIGLIRLFDLEDPTCLFDIRIKEDSRGKGIGVRTLGWIADYIFTQYSHIHRIEGHTRADNFGMRKTFHNSGFVKEAYHRDAWPQGDKLYDSVGYAMIRRDWERKTVTGIKDPYIF